MQTISELKEQAVTQTPLLLFDCALAGGRTERWCTHRVTVGAAAYAARVLRHTVFEIQTASDQGVDGIPRISLALANADSHFSQLERSAGLKGAKLTVRFVFYDLKAGEAVSEARVVFQGVCNPPEEITETTLVVSATNRMSMQRVLLPQIRIQRRCPWNFPTTEEQREEAVQGGGNGKYSRFYRCGYSAGVEGGTGNLNGEAPYASCGYTREDCTARGMFSHFGGLEFVPSSILVRSYGEKGNHATPVQENEARYNDFVPMVYGTGWYNPPVVFARNDGNLTRMEVLLGAGEIQGVLKVLVNDVEIPPGQAGANMTGTGWYNVPTLGTRSGGTNQDFVNSDGSPAGDPYGSMAYLAVVVPSRVATGNSLPAVKVLVQGLKVPVYDGDGAWQGEQFSNNPAWVLLDVLRRSGWSEDEIDLSSFATAAAYCEEPIAATDRNGSATTLPRFQCNAMLRKRRSAGDLMRGIRNGSRLYLTYGARGAVRVGVENTLALQHPTKPEGSNAEEQLDGGWPAYEFGDGTYGLSGILRHENGVSSLRLWARASTDTGNRFAVEFQDAMNEYQQDSLSLVDADDVEKAGQEVTAPLNVLGIPNFHQAARILKFNLDKSLRGNLYVEFDSSVKSLGLRPGDLITVTYLKEGFDRQTFRVLKLAPGPNYRTARITAQVHDDAWYADTNDDAATGGGGGRETGAGIGLPRPIGGAEWDENGEPRFTVVEQERDGSDSGSTVSLSVGFTAPRQPVASGPGTPLVDLSPTLVSSGGLSGPQTFYYAVASVGGGDAEGPLSFLVRARVPAGGTSVKLTGLSFPRGTSGFHVYRGHSPAQLYRIAANLPVSGEFTDDGADEEMALPPDPNYDHANFYWRFELLPESAATLHSATTIGNGNLEMTANRYRGATARITRGPGAGQERTVLSNTATTLTVAPPWEEDPEAGSQFVVAEGGWKFGAMSRTSPADFEAPNRAGQTIQICGRAANVSDGESAAELSVMTRWTLGVTSGDDDDVPPQPQFGLGPGRRGGVVEVSGVSFSDLSNTRTITSGTLSLYYWNEVQGAPSHALAQATDGSDSLIDLKSAGTASPGSYIQIDAEILRVEEVLNSGTRYRTVRGAHGSAATTHAADSAVCHLERRTAVMPFPRGFFGSPYSGTWSYPVMLPDVRVASAELFVTNQFGNSPVRSANLMQLDDYGLRTLSGGQYCIQVEGFLSVDQSAAPLLVVESTHAVRDVFAVLGRAADGEVQVQVNVDDAQFCSLTIPAGSTVSNGVNGASLPPLESGARVSMAVLSVGQTYPGSDLTVVIRL